MPGIKRVLGKNLARILREKGISQTELARLLHVSFQTVNGYIHGRAGLSSQMITKIAKVLEIEETDLVQEKKETSPNHKKEFPEISQKELKEMRSELSEFLKQVKPSLLQASEPKSPVHNEVFQLLNELEPHELEPFLKTLQEKVAEKKLKSRGGEI